MGGEWDIARSRVVCARTVRRWRVLTAKVVSLWITAAAILLLDWVVLAAASPILKGAYPLSGPGLSWSSAWTTVAADAVRAPFDPRHLRHPGRGRRRDHPQLPRGARPRRGLVVASLAVAGNFAAIAPWTFAYWVSGWMQFHSHGYVIYHFWVDGFPTGVHAPGALTGCIGLLATAVAVVAGAVAVFRRVDITA